MITFQLLYFWSDGCVYLTEKWKPYMHYFRWRYFFAIFYKLIDSIHCT